MGTNGFSIEVKGLRKVYGRGDASVEALRGVDLRVRRGDCVAIMGTSGSGKTTLLHILGGLDRPSGGAVMVMGRDLAELSPHGRTLHRRRTVGFVFQQFHLIPTLSAVENVEMPLRYAGVGSRERRQRATALLDRVGLGARMTHRPSALSGGEQQRVALARAVVGDPAVVLADEPTGNLDTQTADEIVALLLSMASERTTTVVIVTHDQDVAARAHQTFHMRDGQMVDGPPAQGST